MAQRKTVIPFEPYQVYPAEDHLWHLITADHDVVEGVPEHPGLSTHTFTSLSDRCSEIVLTHKLFTPVGEFQRIVLDEQCPRIISIIQLANRPIGVVMLVNSSASMGTAFEDDCHSLGFVGLYTREEHQGQGLSRYGLRAVQREIDRLTGHLPEPERQLHIVQTMGHVLDWVRLHMSTPVARM